MSRVRKGISGGLATVLLAVLLAACTDAKENAAPSPSASGSNTPSSKPAESAEPGVRGESNVYYEIFVRSFADSNGDGIGDLNGITANLDYLNDGKPGKGKDLGVSGIWLMPINPSPSYHGYDVTDYEKVNPDYGTLDDLNQLTGEAHKRGIKVIMDLVVNHTSSQHPWFLDSASGKDSKHRNWYSWAEDMGRDIMGSSAAGASSAWHKKNGSHYLGIFWDGMPDLNFDEPEVRKEVVRVGKFWLEQGIDGFRVDAAKHIYEDLSIDKNKKTMDKNVTWWLEFRQAMQQVKPDVYIVGEVWDATARVGPYLKAMDSAFNFDLAGSLIAFAQSEKATDIGFTLSRIHEYYSKVSGGKFIEAPFLSNHDQTRVMTALKDNVDHAKTAAAMLLTMPGNPFVYYGEELGVNGNKPDERIREPFPWKRTPGAPGETTWELAGNRGDGSVSVEAEDESPGSLLNRYRMLISWREQDETLRSNVIEAYKADNDSIIAYVRSAGDARHLVLTNLSGKRQTITLTVTKANPVVFQDIVFTTDDTAKLKEGKLEMPPYASAVLKP